MTFPEALVLVFNDSLRCTRRAWANRSIYVSVIEGRLCISGYYYEGGDDGRAHPWIITESDYFAGDWEVVE